MNQKHRDWHFENHEKVPEVSWAKAPSTNKVFFYDARHNKDHSKAVAYALNKHNGLRDLYGVRGNLIKAGVASILACQKLVRDRLS